MVSPSQTGVGAVITTLGVCKTVTKTVSDKGPQQPLFFSRQVNQ